LESLVRELNLQERVIFAGYQAEPQRFYQALDVFALSSRHEGLPLALLEAWAAGLPVVVPAVGGIAKVVAHEATGLLFPREDEGALAAAMGRVMRDAALAGRLANAGRELVRRDYSLARMADEYERHYRELMAV
jgi:glycosyltransferase involved in cell wall biosynthesis